MNPVASTLDAIEARLKEIANGPTDISALQVVEHKATGLRFRVGPMKRANHEAWFNLRYFEEKQHADIGAREAGAPLQRDRSDLYLLQHAVWTEDGQKLTEPNARLLLDGEGFGPSTYALCEAAAHHNPPREAVVAALAQVWGASASNIVFWRVLKEAGLFKMLLDRFEGTPEEREVAEREIAKVTGTLEFWEAAFEADRAAAEMDVGVYDRVGKPDFANLAND